jgi:2-methylisocitrate lyase-like PEP mutase family enzyme
LHDQETPLVLWSIWDAGSAKAVADAGANAIVTGRWAVAAAQEGGDGEALPMEAALVAAAQIVGAVELPVSVDFEGGYAVVLQDVASNARLLIETGAVGLNFEDRLVGGEGLYPVAVQYARIAAIKGAADAMGVPLFINARMDVFFIGNKAPQAELMDEALMRAATDAQAGAYGVFVPGLADLDLIAELCEKQVLPVNVMRMGQEPEIGVLAQVDVKRISHGPGPCIDAMEALGAAALV